MDGYRGILNDIAAPVHALIGVGQFITDELTRNRQGCFGRWLSDSIGGLAATDKMLVCTLAALGAKLATTNYDNLIEDCTGRSPVTWRDRALATEFFREPTHDVLHLHGHYRQSDSVILGARSYDEICRDEFFQAALRGWMINGTLVLVGCGVGLEDPNFGVLLDWARTTLAECHHSHFILVRSGDADEWRNRLHGMPIYPVPYGGDYRDLTPFLQSLAERVRQQRVPERLSLLLESQTDFDARWAELERNQEDLPALEYFRCSRTLAAELWRAGGRRRAAMAFTGRVSFQGQSLLIHEYVEFALDAAEWLLEEGLASMAANHLSEITQKLAAADVPALHDTRFQQLRVRCMDAMCAYTESLRAIEEALSHTNDGDRARLIAERCEIHFLQGDLNQAVSDSM